MSRLSVDFSSAFQRDIKKLTKRHKWNLKELEKVISLIIENSPSSLEELRSRHQMHALKGKRAGRKECHIANVGDWHLIWSSNDKVVYIERTGTHDDLFSKWF